MLQFVDSTNDRFSVAELAQMAIEGGCMWIQMHLPDLTDDDIKALLAPDVVELCRESGAFLVLEDHPEAARELGLHGVHLTRGFFSANPALTPAAVREELGPEAVVGVEAIRPEDAIELARLDIDYVSLPRTWTLAQIAEFASAVRAADCPIPIVATGCESPQDAAEAMAAGASGVAVGKPIACAADPAEAAANFIQTLASR